MTPIIALRHSLFLLAAIAFPACGRSAAADISFKGDIAPILSAKCVTCHNPEKAKGHYDLQTYERMVKAGDSEKAPIVPGNAKASWLFHLITTTDEADRMPQKDKPLPIEQVRLIEAWIDNGADFDGHDKATPLSALIETAHPMPPQTYPRPAPITALAIHPTTKRIYANGYHEVTVWDAGKLAARWTNAPKQLHALAVSDDGQSVAYAGGSPGRSGEAGIFRAVDGLKVRTIGRYPDAALAIAFTTGSDRVIVGGADNSIHVYETATGRELLAIQQHADWVTALSVSKDGTQLLSGSRDKSARIYDLTTGELLTTYTEHTAPIWATVLIADDKEALTAGRDKVIRRWATDDGKNLGKFECDAEVLTLAVAGDHLFAGLSNGTILEFSLAKRSLTRTYHAGRDFIYAATTTEEELAAGSQTGQIHLWEIASGRAVADFTAAP